jgi:hypothetical protein
MAGMGRSGGNPNADAPTTAKYWLEAADTLLPNGRDLSALATGIILNTAGVPSKATEAVHFAKGPWKLFSTVRSVLAAQTISVPVVDGDNNGIVRARGFIVSDGTDRTLTLKINGSATNVTMQALSVQNLTVTSSRAFIGSQGVYGAFFELQMLTAKTAAGLKRSGFVRIITASATLADTEYFSAFHFKDAATAITSIDLDCGNATGMAVNSYVIVEEGIVS